MRKIWHNGILKPESEGKLSIYDSALMYGDMAFEMMRTFNKKTFRLIDHIYRLYNSINILQIQIPYRRVEIYDAHEELLAYHIKEYPKEEEWRTLINVSRGILPIYQDLLKAEDEANIIMSCFPLRYVLRGNSYKYDNGINLKITSQRAIPEYLLDPKIKSRSRQHYRMAELEASPHTPLLIDPDGFITETTGANFFIVKDGKIYTPEGRNCLRGISRQYILELCYRRCIECYEKNLTVYDVLTADEAFITCTPYCIIPVSSIDNIDFIKADMTINLTNLWMTDVNCDFVAQAERWDNV